jgi:glycosyltransferase involved in cell wall biosynthesis
VTATPATQRDCRKIAYCDFGLNAATSRSLRLRLEKAFPENPMEVIGLGELVSLRNWRNLADVLLHYGWEISSGRKRFKDCLVRTRSSFESVRRALRCRLTPQEYRFTFQTGSRVDGSVSGIPHFVYTDHTHLANRQYPGNPPHWRFSKEWIALEREIYHRAARVFTFSSNIGRSLMEDYGVEPAKIRCAYAGSNLPSRTGAAGRVPGGKNILFVGMEWERKGGPLLVAAFRRVLQTHPDAKLVIVGCMPAVSVPNCEIHGLLPIEEVATQFQRANIFCMPTRCEPFGVVFVEAMLAGLPVVATKLGALPDMVQNGVNGFLIESGDERGLASALSALLADPSKCAVFGNRGAALAEQRYTWENTVAIMRSEIAEAGA